MLIGGPVSGGAVNPARALGPMIVSGTFTDWWAYIVGPVAGAIIAAVVYDRFLAHASTPEPSTSTGEPDTRTGAVTVDDGFSWGGPDRVDPSPASGDEAEPGPGPHGRTGTARP